MTTEVVVINRGPKPVIVDTMGRNTRDPAAPDNLCKVTQLRQEDSERFYVYENQYLMVKEAP